MLSMLTKKAKIKLILSFLILQSSKLKTTPKKMSLFLKILNIRVVTNRVMRIHGKVIRRRLLSTYLNEEKKVFTITKEMNKMRKVMGKMILRAI